MKKYLLFLFALLTTVTVWAQEFIPLQMGENNGIELGPNDSDKGYLSFTPEVTDYYVISTTCAESHYMAFNLWSDSLYYADSKPDALLSTHACHCGYPNKLYAGITYIMRLGLNGDFTTSVPAEVVIRPGHIVIPDPECAELSNVLRPLPVVAYEGQEVNLTVNPGVTISGLTATSGGQPVAMTVDESGTVYTFTMPDADVVISGSYEMPSLQLGDNEIEVTYNGTQYAFVPEESGAYVFSMNCGAEAQVRITENNDYITIGYAAAGETVKVGAMLEANTTYYVVPAANAEDGIEGVILNIAKLELPPITVGENVIDVPFSNFFDYSFTPTESGDYRFYTTGDAEIRPYLKIYLGENMIGQCYYGNSDLDLTVSLEAGVTYTVKAAVNPDMPAMSVMHLNVTNEGGSSGGDDNIVLQMGDNGPFNITNDGVYLSFTPQETDYYVFSTFATAEHVIAMSGGENLFFESAYSEAAPFGGLHAAVYGIPEKLNAGVTYTIIINALFGSGQTYVRVDKGYLVSPDAESAYLANVLTPLPTVAYEGQEVKLTNQNGATINNLTATANGEPVEVTVDGTGMVYTFTMPAADVVLSGSVEIPTLQLGDNEISSEVNYAFTPAESGAYVFSSSTVAVGELLLNDNIITMGFGGNGQTFAMGAMLEADATYTVHCFIPDGSAIMNVAKLDLLPITVGENEIYAVGGGQYFEYPFTAPVSGEYTFSITGEDWINPEVSLLLGEEVIAQCSSEEEELSFTATLEAGTTYIFRSKYVGGYNVVPVLLTVTAPGGSSGGDEFITLHLGENGPIGINGSEAQYMKFTPEETGYYVFVGNSDVANEMYINLWTPNLYKVDSEPEVISGVSRHVSYLGYPQLLYAGQTYNMSIYAYEEDETGVATINVVKGYLVSPDAESADLASLLGPLPVAAYEGQEVKLAVIGGVTIHSLTAETANGDPIELTLDDSGTVYSFTMPAVDVTISGSGEMASLHLGDNEVNLTEQGTQFTFTPAESGAYVFSMDCGAMAAMYVAMGNDLVAYDEAEAGQTLEMGAMLKAGVTYLVYPMIREGYIEGAILNIAKRELAPITIGENVIETPNNGFCFDYPFTPPVSGDYTFYTTDDEDLYPAATLMLGEQEIAMCYNGAMDLNFTATLEAGVTYTLKLSHSVGGSGLLPLHLTVVSPPLPSFAINLPSEFEHGTVECDKETADYGEIVTLTVTPDQGYELETLTVTTIDATSGAPLRANVDLTPGENGTYTFEMPAAPVAVSASFKQSTPTAVEYLNIDSNSGQRYNLMGQPVGKDYKGIVIENGKKIIVR